MKAKYPEPVVILKSKNSPNTGKDLKPGSTGNSGPMLSFPALHVALIPI